MSAQKIVMSVLACLVTASCATGPQYLDKMQPQAVDLAQRRGAFEMNCPAATAQMLSRQELQPLVDTFRYSGPMRAEYTIGVAGCGKRTTYIVICPEDGNNCYAGGSRTEIQQ
jgi:hypothetical protein